MNEETKLVFAQLDKALSRLEEALKLPVGPERVEIDATIQRFEFCVELFWKALKKRLADDAGITINGPKPVLQQAYASNWITNEKVWLDMLDDRNLTSHTYKQDLADQIYHKIKIYAPFLREQCQSKVISSSS